MSTVTVEVNGRAYAVGCEDGQEAHVDSLAREFDRQVREVAQAVGQVGEVRLMLMAALMTADELADTRARLAETQAELARSHGEKARIETRAAQALQSAANRVEALGARVA